MHLHSWCGTSTYIYGVLQSDISGPARYTSSCRHRPNGIFATVGKTSASNSSLARQCVSRSRSGREGQRAHHGWCTQGEVGVSAKLPLVFFLDARTGGGFQEVSSTVCTGGVYSLVLSLCMCDGMPTNCSYYVLSVFRTAWRITLIVCPFQPSGK